VVKLFLALSLPCILADSTLRHCRFYVVLIPGSAQLAVNDEAPVSPKPQRLGHPPPNPPLIRTHGSCGRCQLDELAASCAASTSHRTSPFALSPRFALRYSAPTHRSSFIRIPITNPIPPALLAYPSLGFGFPPRASHPCSEFPRCTPTNLHNTALHSTHFRHSHFYKIYITSLYATIITLLSIFVLADKTTL